MTRISFRRSLLALTALGLAVRLVYALGVMGGREVRGDGRQFHFLAEVLGSEGRYLQPFRFLFQNGTEHPDGREAAAVPGRAGDPARSASTRSTSSACCCA